MFDFKIYTQLVENNGKLTYIPDQVLFFDIQGAIVSTQHHHHLSIFCAGLPNFFFFWHTHTL